MKLLLSVRRKIVYVQFVSPDTEIHSDMPPIPVRRGGTLFGQTYLALVKAARAHPGEPVEFPDPEPAAKKT